VLVDLAVMIADGGEAICDIDVLRLWGASLCQGVAIEGASSSLSRVR
jgi:hypothetical protein